MGRSHLPLSWSQALSPRAKQEASDQKRAQDRDEERRQQTLRSDPVSPTMARNRDPKKDDYSKEEMAVATDATALVDEPESMVNPGFIQNDSCEKGPDSPVALVYLNEIRRDISAGLFCKQNLTLISPYTNL
ncbi:unnamed protein product [Rangifer tarandus platyrhynchus]|uniref:Uncharacterized protein n=1 Tax=Rangifer tarandus platyrhynchus TaxID=3082113 RepID=A0ABN8ZDT6_RANTA|nr:unnamed protein product [Rangifer tarandus platyrhynchus]